MWNLTLIQTNHYNTHKHYMKKKIGDVVSKIPGISGLATTAVLKTKIVEVENKDAKISDIQGKYLATAVYNKCNCDIFDSKIKKNWSMNLIFLIS